ncbi:MAG: potassium-transporting ATPase potassium-binding subunit [Solirubrobacterales bacterium]|jgi:K+-transporting ATPase ATPase A chain|nr:potassium-transporting ATPase potassium-binding subunit [Solirubrobacterales bacterium]
MAQGWLQFAVFIVLLTALVPLLGTYLAKVFQGERVFLSPVVGPIERLGYRLFRVRPGDGQDWKAYARSALVFSLLSWLLLYLILRTQSVQPFNPEGFGSGPWNLSFNTTSSFVTNTNWQYYGGETTLSYFAQMAGLAVQNFLSAAVGIAVLAAVIRGFAARSATSLGNFWRDLTRITLYILLPISFVAALVLVSQGVVQTLDGSQLVQTIAGGEQTLSFGPVASQEAIKLLGTNGGGFFNVNSAFPFENPSSFTNVLEIFLMLLIPASLPYAFGRIIGNRRQGWAIYAAMMLMFVVSVAVVFVAEQHGSPAQHAAGVATHAFDGSSGGNMEGKEVRNGIAQSSLWTAVTTVTSCGAVNAAFDSLTGIGGLMPTANLSTGEVIFGGVGSGLYGMLMLVLLTVFIAGLMVGRTPEFLGKKIEAREVKLVLVAVLATPLLVLIGTAWAVAGHDGTMSIYNPGPQGFSESLYAYMSQANNNGSAFAGYTGFLQPNAPGNGGSEAFDFANLLGGLVMLFGRFLPLLAVLAVAGSLAKKKVAPVGAGTFRADSPTFVVLLIGVVVIVAALTFFPAFLLGPVAQGLTDQLF